MIEIFNIRVFGEDAKAFLELDINAKVKWIKKVTNQQDDNEINEFLANLPQYKNIGEICLGCKLSKDDKNISKANAVKIATSGEQEVASESGERNSVKRPRQTKTTKG